MIGKTIAMLLLLLLAATAAVTIIHLSQPGWYVRYWYPLEYESYIVSSSVENGLDPALVASVINEESGFDPSSHSQAGALGLMQLMPDTARWIAGKTGGSDFSLADLDDPQINIAYGSWYLSYLLDRYDGSELLALAAYNGGAENVDRWQASALAAGRPFDSMLDIPYEETRTFVADVMEGKGAFRKAYDEELRI